MNGQREGKDRRSCESGWMRNTCEGPFLAIICIGSTWDDSCRRSCEIPVAKLPHDECHALILLMVWRVYHFLMMKIFPSVDWRWGFYTVEMYWMFSSVDSPTNTRNSLLGLDCFKQNLQHIITLWAHIHSHVSFTERFTFGLVRLLVILVVLLDLLYTPGWVELKKFPDGQWST